MDISKQDIDKELIAITNQLLIDSDQPYQRSIKLDASLQRHLGIDSLGRSELFRRIEKHFQVSMPDRLLAEVDTLNDIANFLATASPRIKNSAQQKVITSHGLRSSVDPTYAKTLIDVLLMYGEKSPDKAHIYFQHENGQEEIITYGKLLTTSLQVANGLQERGLREGDTVAIMQPTHPDFFYSFFGVLLAGGIPVPIYPPFRAHMLEAYARTEARILQSAGVRMLITFGQAEKLSHLLKAFVPSLNVVTTVEALMSPQAIPVVFSAREDSFAFIQYTSGSTSDPKGVLLTHYNLLSNIRAYGKAIQVTPDDVTVSWLPLYHDFGLIGAWLGSFYHGVPLVLMTPFSFLNHPERWLWAIHYHRGTVTGAPNFAYELCVRKIDPALIEGLDLTSWRLAANGAEKVYPRTLEQFADKFAPYGLKRSAIVPVYGLAESTVCLTIPPMGREFRVDYVDRQLFEEERSAVSAEGANTLPFVACGMPIEGHEVRIVDEENAVLPERKVGSVQFRGPSNMQGYYNNPRATLAVYHDGWLDSGDLGYQADGELFITGRRKDLIIKAGRNLYPAEIEELVGNVTGVRQGCVAAFGATDAVRGTEQLIVVAETRENNHIARNQILSDINDAMASTLDMVPDHVVLVPPRTVPKTSSGKLQRAACKTMYLAGRMHKRHLPAWMQVSKLGAEWLMRKTVSMLSIAAKCIYTAYVAMISMLTIVPLYFIVLVASPETVAHACRSWARLMLRLLFCPCKVDGKEYLTLVSPVVFTVNHASYFDAMVTLALVPPGTRFVAKKELFSMPLVGRLLRKLNYIPVDRTDLPKGIEDTKAMEMALKQGDSILIFPEGTFGYASGLRPFRMGAFKIAAESNVAICPIALAGTRAILRDSEKIMRPGGIRVTVCKPVMAASSEWSDITQLKNTVRSDIAAFCGEPSLDFIAAQTVAPTRSH